ncbi:MAG: alpha/beta hydrolase [Gammaproteobacteria bacterium]|nr:alpha/beta hydrolase [Gammaproteobacteria bacterium]
MEQRGFFDNRRGKKLFYAAHGRPGAGSAWLFCNPFLEEKTFSHPAYVSLARTIAANGGFAVRFDYEGDGDSDGEYDSLGLGDWVADVEAVAAFAQQRWNVTAPALFGLRLGAAVACMAAARIGSTRLLLWEPVVNGGAYLEDCLKLNLTTQLSTHKRVIEGRPKLLERLARDEQINIAGYQLGGRMAAQLQAFDLLQQLSALSGYCQIDVVRLPPRAKADTSPVLTGVQRVIDCAGLPFWQESRQHDPQGAFAAASHELIGGSAA